MPFAKIKNNSFLKPIAILASGSLLAQLITFFCSPLLTRIYSTEDFGIFTFIISSVAIFSGSINGRYDVSIVTSRDNEVYPLIKISLLLMLVFSIAIYLGFYIYVSFDSVDNPIKQYLFFIFILLLIAGLINVLNAYNNRHQNFKLMTQVYLIRSIAQNLLMIILGLVNLKSVGLLLSQLLGQLFGIRKQSSNLSLLEMFSCSMWTFKKMIVVAKKYKSQIILSMPSTLLNALSYSLINIFIGMTFGMSILGLYSISVRILGLPLNIFSSNISKVHLSSANAEIKETNIFYRSTIKTFWLSLAIIFPAMGILIVFAQDLVVIIFGEAWRYSGLYIQILAPMFALRFIAGSLGFSFIIAKKQKIEFYIQTSLLIILSVLYVFLSFFHFSEISFLIYISISYTIVYVIEIYKMLVYSKIVIDENYSSNSA